MPWRRSERGELRLINEPRCAEMPRPGLFCFQGGRNESGSAERLIGAVGGAGLGEFVGDVAVVEGVGDDGEEIVEWGQVAGGGCGEGCFDHVIAGDDGWVVAAHEGEGVGDGDGLGGEAVLPALVP